MLSRRCDDEFTISDGYSVRKYDEGAVRVASECIDDMLDLVGTRDAQLVQPHSERRRHDLH